MRWPLVLVVVSGCAGSSGHAPAWPKTHEAETDGGESLAPHVARAVAVAADKTEDEVKPAAPAATAAAVTPDAAPSVATPAATQPQDETINTEEIIIEIDE
jgi:hypothetical protein